MELASSISLTSVCDDVLTEICCCVVTLRLGNSQPRWRGRHRTSANRLHSQ